MAPQTLWNLSPPHLIKRRLLPSTGSPWQVIVFAGAEKAVDGTNMLDCQEYLPRPGPQKSVTLSKPVTLLHCFFKVLPPPHLTCFNQTNNLGAIEISFRLPEHDP